MTKITTAALAAATLFATLPVAALAEGHRHHGAHVQTRDIAIRVSCARYSLPGVIWDRPMPVFLDDLVAAGYSQERAYAIGNRVCRDESGVGNTNYTGARMQEILRTDPPRRGRR